LAAIIAAIATFCFSPPDRAARERRPALGADDMDAQATALPDLGGAGSGLKAKGHSFVRGERTD